MIRENLENGIFDSEEMNTSCVGETNCICSPPFMQFNFRPRWYMSKKWNRHEHDQPKEKEDKKGIREKT
jgi:hypothetical protein